MARAAGIDLGTTKSVVAVWENGRARVIAAAEGARATPSVVAYTEDGQRLVGHTARRQAVLNPEGTISSAKRFVGRKWGEVEEESSIVPYRLTRGPNDAVRFDVRGRKIAPEEVLALVLGKLVEDASMSLGERVAEAVITVPACFNDAQRRATRNAGEIAGLKVLRIINEPTAAALAYGLEKRRNETVLVFDLGGGTFDVSILDVGEGVCEVRSTSGDSHLGGDDFDKRVVDWLAEELKKSTGLEVRGDRRALKWLHEAAEKAKCELSTLFETRINLPFIAADASGPRHLTAALTRARFEELTRDLVQRCLKPVEQALADAGLTARDIDEVILVGGSTRIPAVQELVKRLMGGRQPNMSVHPDEVVAMGAAVQAAILQGGVADVVLLDVIPLSLGVETLGGAMTRLIERNTTIPSRREEIFTTAEDMQTAVDIPVLQGEREMAADNRLLGRFRLAGIRPAPRGVPQIKVTFEIDASGILHVTARDQESGREQQVTISDSTNLSRDEVNRMVDETRRYAAEDALRREKVEARNRADSLAHQLERALKALAEEVPLQEKARCEQLIQETAGAVRDERVSRERYGQLASDLEQALRMISAVADRRDAGRWPGAARAG